MEQPRIGPFPNIQFNTVPHLQLVQFIEHAIDETGADTLFTHHPGDINDDHRHTSLACQAAARMYQRRNNGSALRGLHFVEVPSSTDWSFERPSGRFTPNTFVKIGPDLLKRKITALEAYEGVMRPYPHPRSAEVLTALAVLRGAEAGMEHAEAFETVFQDLGSNLGA